MRELSASGIKKKNTREGRSLRVFPSVFQENLFCRFGAGFLAVFLSFFRTCLFAFFLSRLVADLFAFAFGFGAGLSFFADGILTADADTLGFGSARLGFLRTFGFAAASDHEHGHGCRSGETHEYFHFITSFPGMIPHEHFMLPRRICLHRGRLFRR